MPLFTLPTLPPPPPSCVTHNRIFVQFIPTPNLFIYTTLWLPVAMFPSVFPLPDDSLSGILKAPSVAQRLQSITSKARTSRIGPTYPNHPPPLHHIQPHRLAWVFRRLGVYMQYCVPHTILFIENQSQHGS